VDIESVTIIVSAFMLGLGLGSLAGGELADRFPHRLIALFAVIELCTAAFGFCSPNLIHAAGRFAVNHSLLEIGLLNFALLLVPTTLMGATLPILVAHACARTETSACRWASSISPTRWEPRSARRLPDSSPCITWALPRPSTRPRS
jgi:MFS family permease